MVIVPIWMRVILAAGICFASGAIAALYMTSQSLGYFGSLDRPLLFAMPIPVIFFALVVTYAIISIASALMWIHDPRPWDFRGWVPLFFTHLLVQVGWLILLFAYNVVFVAMLMAFVLATYVFILTAAAWERSKIAFWLLLVYLAWTLYALGMNIAVWGVN